MKKPMIKALACSLAFTLALSTPVAVSAEGIANVYSETQKSENDTNTNTNTNTDTNSSAESIDQETYAQVIGLVVNPEEASVEVNKEIELSASILVDCEAQAGTEGFRSMSLNDLDEDMVVVFEGEEILAAKLAEKLTWYEDSENNNVKVTNNNDGTATVRGMEKGNTTVSVKLGDVYKASASVKVKQYSVRENFSLATPVNPYVKHVVNMNDYLTRDGNEDIIWNVLQNNKKAKAATITADGILTLKKETKGNPITVTAVSERGLYAFVTFEIEAGNPIAKINTISADKTELTIKEADLYPKANATITFTAKDTAKETTDYITWTTNKPNVVSVAGNGATAVITAQNPGKAVVTAKSTSGKSKKITITVKAPLERIDGIVATKTNIYNGQSVQLQAIKVPANATDKVSFKLTDSKNMKKIATVSSKGMLKASKKVQGTVSVVAYTKGSNAKTSEAVAFEIKPSTITNITINNANLNGKKKVMTLYKNKSYDFEATFQNGVEEMATWSTSKAKVSTVGETGIAKALAAGKANITVSAVTPAGKTVKDKVALTVVQPVTKIQLNKTVATVNPKTKDQTVALKVSKQLPKGAKETITWTIAETNNAEAFGFKVGKTVLAKVTSNSAKVSVAKTAKLGDYVVVKATAASGATEYATITVCNKTQKVQFTDGTNVIKNATVKVGDAKVIGKDYILEVISKDATEATAQYNEDIVSLTSNNKNVRIEGDTIYVVNPGKATITAKTAAGKKATLKLTIEAK